MTVAQKLEFHLDELVCPYGVRLDAKEQLKYMADASLRQRQEAYIRALTRGPLLLDDEHDEALAWVIGGEIYSRESLRHRAQAYAFLVQHRRDAAKEQREVAARISHLETVLRWLREFHGVRFDSAVIATVYGWIDNGMAGECPTPDSPFFNEWLARL